MFTVCMTSEMQDKENIHEMKYVDDADTPQFHVAGTFQRAVLLFTLLSLEKGRMAWHRFQSQTAGLGISALTP